MKQEQLKELLTEMSLEEKIGQLNQLAGIFYEWMGQKDPGTSAGLSDLEEVLTGPAKDLGLTKENLRLTGSILGTAGAEKLKNIQKAYMEAHPHHIPMLFMMDVIHGMKTIFPMPLALGATFEPELAGECAAVAAKEAAVSGLHVTFSPMSDLVRDARWGRVMESTGEDPYLNARFAAAQVTGFQGEGVKDGEPYEPYKICSCVKHFAGYGGAEAGRDYNKAEISEHTFREYYLKAYQAGIDAGADMVMTSFNTVNGVPASVNVPLMRGILRQEMGFDGVLISDYAAIQETVAHGCSENDEAAAAAGLTAGVDIDMMTGLYTRYLKKQIEDGALDEKLLDESVLRVLDLKNRLGLFENPYKDADPEKEREFCLCEEHRALAREAAVKSFVLLKNDGILPIPADTAKQIAFIGPYTDRKEILSSWAITGNAKDCVTIREAAEEVFSSERTVYLQGSPVLDAWEIAAMRHGARMKAPVSEEERRQLLVEAVEAAKRAELVIMPLGEHYLQSGEATSRAMLDLPAVQMELFDAVTAVNPNVVVVLFNGRPLDLRKISRKARAVLEVWMPGTEGGHAVVDVLTGKKEPSGRLPMSFPYCVGQEPIYYNADATGRPDHPACTDHFKSRYIDAPNEPLYPFGYGLSYTEFEISPVQLLADGAESGQPNTDAECLDGVRSEKETAVLEAGHTLEACATVTNTGCCMGTETVQLYIQDVSASVVRPVRELKDVRKVSLQPGGSCEVRFVIREPMLRFLRADGITASEPGRFRVWVTKDAASGEPAEFVLR